VSGFWAGAIPPWAIVAGFCLIIIAGSFGVWVGWGLGEEHERSEAAAELEAERAAAAFREPDSSWHHPANRDQRRMLPPMHEVGNRPWVAPRVAPEVAHEAWLAHTEQALAVANDNRSDEEWLADQVASLHAHVGALLAEHPVEEA